MKRPLGITLLALLLGWLAVGGLMLGAVSPTLAWAGLPWMVYEIAGLAYAGAATVAAVGLWKLAPWAYHAFLVWVGIAAIAGSLPLLTFPPDEPSRWMLPVGWGLMLALLLPLAGYIRRSVRAAA